MLPPYTFADDYTMVSHKCPIIGEFSKIKLTVKPLPQMIVNFTEGCIL